MLFSLVGCDNNPSPTTPTTTSPAPPVTTTPPVVGVPAAPTLEAITPATMTSGAASTITLRGTGFMAGSRVSINGSGVTVGEVSVIDATTITARVTLDRAADIGARNVTVTTDAGTTSAQTLMVNPPAPAISTVTPSSVAVGTTTDITFRGTGFVPGETSVSVSGSGVTVVSVTVASGPQVAATGTSITVRLRVDANAATGSRTITVTSPGGASATFTLTIATPAPTIGSFGASPGIIQQGRSTALIWSGITNATACSINNGVGSVSCADGSITVSPSSTIEYQLMVTGSGGREWMYVTVNVEGPPPVVVVPPPTGSQTFSFTGGSQTFTVPAGVTQITIQAFGAQGANGVVRNLAVAGTGGRGGSVTATIAVTPLEQLTVMVGGQGAAGVYALSNSTPGAGGFNGGGAGGDDDAVTGLDVPGSGGGGASDIRRGGSLLTDRIIVAGGGGAGGSAEGNFAQIGGAGGAGGGTTGGAGASGSNGGSAEGVGGSGGTAAAGGAGGSGGGGADGAAGSSGTGGSGGNGALVVFFTTGGSGGGGGWFGGGGSEGSLSVGGGGGGGASFAIGTATNVSHAPNVRSGNGQVVITW